MTDRPPSYDLTNCTFIIPLRIETADRMRNITTSLIYLLSNFDTNDRYCGLSVKIGKDIFKVANVDIDAQIDSHAKDGFCNVVRIVNVKGKVKKNKLYADSFSLQ